ncbi:GNAT family N-acetyltransferase [bacterium]|nr:GNAT family N-acetyltransferase [bacterium]
MDTGNSIRVDFPILLGGLVSEAVVQAAAIVENLDVLEDQAGVEPSTTGPLPAVLGWGVIKRYSDRQGYRFCCETGVYLWRRHVRKGYGSMIKRALLERCREYRYHHLVAKVVAGNTAGIEYNRRFGYKIVGTQREIGFVKGRWEDVVLMQLVLEDVQPGGMEPGY